MDTLERTKTRKPRRFRVLLHNDDYTTMDFVVEVLVRFFHKSATEATFIMLTVHRKGLGVCGVYPRELAETKVDQVTRHARECGHPLLCTMEPEEGPGEPEEGPGEPKEGPGPTEGRSGGGCR